MKRRNVAVVMAVLLGLGLVGVAAGFGGRWTASAADEERPDMHTVYMAALAERLGVEAEELEQIMVDARAQVIDELLAAGAISEEQAQWMKDRMAEGPEQWQGRPAMRAPMTRRAPAGCHGRWGR